MGEIERLTRLAFPRAFEDGSPQLEQEWYCDRVKILLREILVRPTALLNSLSPLNNLNQIR